MDYLQIPSLPLLLTSFLFIIIMGWRIRKKNNHHLLISSPNLPPPGPWKLPFIGNLHQLVGSLNILHCRITELAKQYGPVMQLQLGEVPAIVISSPEAAKEVLKSQEINFLDKPQVLATAIAFYGCKDMFSAPYGDSWRQLRKICILKLLSAKRVQSFRSIREEEVSNVIKSISLKEGMPINLSKIIFSLLNAITVRTSVGEKFKSPEAFMPITEKIFPALIGLNIADLFPSVKLFYLICWTKFKIKMAHREADKLLEAIIYERRSAKNIEMKTGENESEDLLGFLLNLQEHGDLKLPITTENIKAIILEMFMAGSETASTILEWAMSEIIKNPRVMEKAQKEVREAFINRETVDQTNLQELNYLKLIIKETMRLHPPGALFPRECTKGCKIKGYDIQPKSKVLINAWAIGRDPDYWNEADKFHPERFLNSSVNFRGSDFEFLPFGAGKRICPGMLFGESLMELTLAKLLYHFDWKLPNCLKNENLDMTEAFCFTVKRKQDLIVVAKPYYSSIN